MAAETGFTIDGTLYEVPTLDTFTMDEAQVLYDYSGLTIEDFVPPEDETEEEQAARGRNVRNPGFLRALMHVAYQRAHPKLSRAVIARLIGTANVVDALEHLGAGDDEEDEHDPPASTTEHAEQSKSGSVESSEGSGPDSRTSSDAPGETRRPIGTSESDTSSTSDRPSLVA